MFLFLENELAGKGLSGRSNREEVNCMKKYTTFCVVAVLIFSLFGCSRPKSDTLPIEDFITYTYFEKDIIHPITQKDLDNVPNKEWKEVWKVKGPDQNRVMLLDTQDYKEGDLLFFTNSTGRYPFQGTNHMGEAIDEDFTDTLLAFDPIKQQIVWKYTVQKLIIKGVTVSDHAVFITTNRGPTDQLNIPVNLYCINKTTGKENWRFDFNGSVSSGPIFLDNSIYFCSSGYEGQFINSVNATDGKLIYSNPIHKNIQIFTEEYKKKDVYVSGRTLYFKMGNYDDVFTTYNIDTESFDTVIYGGKDFPFNLTFSDDMTSLLLFFTKYHEEIMAKTENNDKNTLTLSAFNQETQKTRWQIDIKPEKSLGQLLKPIIYNKHFFITFQSSVRGGDLDPTLSKSFMASFNIKTKKIDWSFSIDRYDIQKVFVDSEKIYVSIKPLRDNDRDYYQYKNAYILALDVNTGKILWKIKKGMWLEGIYQHQLLIGDENNLYAIDPN